MGWLRISLSLLIVTALQAAAPAESGAPAMLLRQGWAIQSSADVRETGSVLSTTAFKPRGWYRATLP